jgi:hypothetical protein
MKTAWCILLLAACTSTGCMNGKWVLFHKDEKPPPPPPAATTYIRPPPPVMPGDVKETNAWATATALDNELNRETKGDIVPVSASVPAAATPARRGGDCQH